MAYIEEQEWGLLEQVQTWRERESWISLEVGKDLGIWHIGWVREARESIPAETGVNYITQDEDEIGDRRLAS